MAWSVRERVACESENKTLKSTVVRCILVSPPLMKQCNPLPHSLFLPSLISVKPETQETSKFSFIFVSTPTNTLPAVPFSAMAVATFSNLSTRSFFLQSPSHHHHHHQHREQSFAVTTCHVGTTSSFSRCTPFLSLTVSTSNRNKYHPAIAFSSGDGGNFSGGTGGSGNGGGGGGHDDRDDKDRSRNRSEAILALAEAGRTFESLPKDLAAAIKAGRVPGSIVYRFFELEKSPILRWLLNFGGFKERLLADDLFLTKVGIECGVGIFTKTAAELEKRRERFMKELDFVFADVVMALIADFMLVWLPAPTVSLRPPIAVSAGTISKFFYNCPDNAFQVALAGTSYSFLQRIGAIVRNGAKLFAVGTGASLSIPSRFQSGCLTEVFCDQYLKTNFFLCFLGWCGCHKSVD
ncbi:protein RETICULATA-RELATED 4, chloroplastic-like isoform X2 [Durio zibethinus]|uniref:Protein RETICULATA-RELATED 4, chloroplastic-like isoform X2 n=1 Tax=Durio zibethinus TaxID=66656 RepID=A0A6P5ZVR5_DURZI|nr:protein RETICULATA-RELATED 4, chloroplastic-like isoform X2 [Durio zibethinus]